MSDDVPGSARSGEEPVRGSPRSTVRSGVDLSARDYRWVAPHLVRGVPGFAPETSVALGCDAQGRLTPAQVRGARGMLDWSRFDLAQACGLSVSTVKRVEDRITRSVSDDVWLSIRRAFEMRGTRFLTDDGGGPGMTLGPS